MPLEVKSLNTRRRRRSVREERSSVRTSRVHPDRFSWLIFGGSATIGFFAAREDALRRCMRVRASTLQRARARARVCVYARLVGLGSEAKRRD